MFLIRIMSENIGLFMDVARLSLSYYHHLVFTECHKIHEVQMNEIMYIFGLVLSQNNDCRLLTGRCFWEKQSTIKFENLFTDKLEIWSGFRVKCRHGEKNRPLIRQAAYMFLHIVCHFEWNTFLALLINWMLWATQQSENKILLLRDIGTALRNIISLFNAFHLHYLTTVFAIFGFI